jgi:DNA-binding NtrC family response regulator
MVLPDGPILLVDDDDDTRFLMCSMLRKRGFTVETVDSGEACLAHLAVAPVAFVVTDVQMPGMSGVELCRIIRLAYPDVIAIVISGLTTRGVMQEAAGTGAFTFLPKPVSIATLEAALHRADDWRVARSS